MNKPYNKLVSKKQFKPKNSVYNKKYTSFKVDDQDKNMFKITSQNALN